jgi:hypothetical protein
MSMRKIALIPVLVLLLMGSIIWGQTKEVPELSKKNIHFIYTFIINDILNAGTVGFMMEPIIFQNVNEAKSHISVYPIQKSRSLTAHYLYDINYKISLTNIGTPNLKKVKINSQIKTIYRRKKPEDILSSTTEKNCIATLGFGDMFYDGKYFYLECKFEAYPIGDDWNDAWCIYKFRKMPNDLIYFTHKYAYVGSTLKLDEFELTYLISYYKDRL